MKKSIIKISKLGIGILLAVLIGFASQTAQARKISHPNPGHRGSWRLIGQTHAQHTVDHDAIIVRGPYDNFRAIKFKVTDAPLNMTRMVVTYDNGVPDNINVRQNIRQGGESRVIDLRGAGKRRLRRIDFWYNTKSFLRGKADVTVFGKK